MYLWISQRKLSKRHFILFFSRKVKQGAILHRNVTDTSVRCKLILCIDAPHLNIIDLLLSYEFIMRSFECQCNLRSSLIDYRNLEKHPTRHLNEH